uniref:Uncharacterized protein n=1 Tax=Noctiluca scintillans TaxID=2966 RepID=A0A7S1A0X9_NOCSC
MADLLVDGEAYSTFAPLSHGQTVAMGQRLQDQIQSLLTKCDELEIGLQEQHHDRVLLQTRLCDTDARMQRLADDLTHTNSTLDAASKGLERTSGVVGQVQSGLTRANDDIAGLREQRKVSNAKLEQLGHDVFGTQKMVGELKDTDMRKLCSDMELFRQNLDHSDLAVAQLRKEFQFLSTELEQDRAQLKTLMASDTRNDLLKTNTVVHILEKRLMDVNASLKATRLSVQDLQEMAQESKDVQDKTKSHVLEMQKSVKQAHAHVTQVHEDLDRAGQSLSSTQGRLGKVCAGLDCVTSGQDQIRTQVQSLKDSHTTVQDTISSLKDDVAETGSTLHSLRKCLSQTNALVLPNLHMDLGSQKRSSSRSGQPKMDFNSMGQNRMAWI